MISKSRNTLCIIPARGGSKGLKKKNLQLLGGKPLVYWPIKAVLEAKKRLPNQEIKIIVSTDDKDIAKVALDAGADVPFLRPEREAEDFTTTEQTLKYSLEQAEKYYQVSFDLGLFLTPTDVFRKWQWIKTSIDKMLADPNLESCFVVSPTTKNFWKNEENMKSRLLLSMETYSSRQIKEPIFREDTGLTCVSKASLWRERLRIGNNVEFIENDLEEIYCDVHSQFDLHIANKTLEFCKKFKPDMIELFND